MVGFDIALALFVIGVLLLVAELFHPGLFILAPATALIIMGAIGMLVPGLFDWSGAAILIPLITLLACALTLLLYRRFGTAVKPTTTSGDSLIGQDGLVETMVLPDSIKGKVRIDNRLWSATAAREIDVGKHVKVVSSKGVHIVVEEKEK